MVPLSVGQTREGECLDTFPTEGKPIRATLASPDFCTSKPVPPPDDLPVGSSSCARYRASFAFSKPRWYSVAYFGVIARELLSKPCIDSDSSPYSSVLWKESDVNKSSSMLHLLLTISSAITAFRYFSICLRMSCNNASDPLSP